MSLLPRSDPDAYRGSPFGWRFLLFLAALNLFRGSIHLFASDGGAGRIAGIDLTAEREVIVFLFAVMGLQQIAFGLIHLAVALRYRRFVALLLALETGKQLVAVVVIWLYKPLPVAAPGKFGALILLPSTAAALLSSLRSSPRERTKE